MFILLLGAHLYFTHLPPRNNPYIQFQSEEGSRYNDDEEDPSCFDDFAEKENSIATISAAAGRVDNQATKVAKQQPDNVRIYSSAWATGQFSF